MTAMSWPGLSSARRTERDGERRSLVMPGVATLLTITVLLLTVIGLIAVLSASSVLAIKNYETPWYFFGRQALWSVMSIGAFWYVVRIDHRRFQRWALPMLGAAIVGLLAVLAVGREVDGAKRWVALGPLTLQPSELAKLAVVLFAASVMTRRRHRMNDWWYASGPVLLWLGAICLLVMLQPDLDTAMEIAVAAIAVLFVAGLSWRVMSRLALLGLAAVAFGVLRTSYRFERLLAFMNPTADPQDSGYQAHQSLMALGSGRVGGVGLGEGKTKWGLLPNGHTDFIFANIGEELGLLGTLLVLALFAVLVTCGFMTALRALRAGDDYRFGGLVATGITAWFGVQTCINLAMVVGIIPVSGTPLPFVSNGGSSLLLCLIAGAILVNIARQVPDPAEVAEVTGTARVGVPQVRPAAPERPSRRHVPRRSGTPDGVTRRGRSRARTS